MVPTRIAVLYEYLEAHPSDLYSYKLDYGCTLSTLESTMCDLLTPRPRFSSLMRLTWS